MASSSTSSLEYDENMATTLENLESFLDEPWLENNNNADASVAATKKVVNPPKAKKPRVQREGEGKFKLGLPPMKIMDDGLRDVYGQHPKITEWVHTRQNWSETHPNMLDFAISRPILIGNSEVKITNIPPMIVDNGRTNAMGINLDLAKWFEKKAQWETANYPRLYTRPQPAVMTIDEIYPPLPQEIVSAAYGSTTKHPPPSLLRDIYEEYLVSKDITIYMEKTLTTPLRYTFMYMRGELLRKNMGDFLEEYTAQCEPLLLVPPKPNGCFLEEMAFITKYLIYSVDKEENGVVRNFSRGLFGTTPTVSMFKKVGRWLNSHSFISAKGTFGFDVTTDKINFGCINVFIA